MLKPVNYKTKKIDDLEAKTYDGSDLGMSYLEGAYTFKVWSPHAKNVHLNLYQSGSIHEKTLLKQLPMTQTENVWTITIEEDLEHLFYTYAFHHEDEQITEAPDLYSKAVGINGDRTAIIHLENTNPTNWETDQHVMQEHLTDAIIWEVHVEDFSSDPASGIRPDYQGKYLGFTEDDTTLYNAGEFPTGLNYLAQLNVNYVHLLPIYDFANNEEDNTYNWGYDPKNYMVPEGKYSTNPRDPHARIRELKQLIQSLHQKNIGVIMDVVYNHTYETEDSWFEYTVPGYYFRKDEHGKFSDGSGVGNETASERQMMRKYMIDSLLYWVEEYHIDGFRFDLMGVHDTETMNEIRRTLDVRGYEQVILYGEPWAGGPLALPDPYKAANIENIAEFSDRIGVFNEVFRDAIKGDVFIAEVGGFLQGNLPSKKVTNSSKKLAAALMAHTQFHAGEYQLPREAAWASKPTEIINYSSSHDNLSLYDKLSATTRQIPECCQEKQLIFMHKINATLLFTAQGGIFYQAGEEFMRTKYGHANSYNASISINHLDWARAAEFYEVSQYYRELGAIRKKYVPLRDETTRTAEAMYFDDLPDDLLAYCVPNVIDDELAWENLVVLANTGEEPALIPLPHDEDGHAQDWTILATADEINQNGLGSLYGDKIFVKPKELYLLALERK